MSSEMAQWIEVWAPFHEVFKKKVLKKMPKVLFHQLGNHSSKWLDNSVETAPGWMAYAVTPESVKKDNVKMISRKKKINRARNVCNKHQFSYLEFEKKDLGQYKLVYHEIDDAIL